MKTFLVTGATGFLGKAVCQKLISENNIVYGIGRNKEKGKELEEMGVKFHSIDFTKREELDLFFQTIKTPLSCIIHSAALSSPWGEYDQFYQANVVGTKNLLDMSKKYHHENFIYISSPSIYFNFKDGFNLNEDTEIANPAPSFYSRTKYLGELEVQKALCDNFRAIILRPRGFFGPGDQSLLPRLLKAHESGRLKMIGSENTLIDLTYIDNIVHSIQLAMENIDKYSGEAFNITNGEPVKLWDFVNEFMQKTNRPLVTKKMNYKIVYFISFLIEKIHILFQLKSEPVLTRYTCSFLACSQTLDITKAKEKLGYRPIINMQEGLERYISWSLEHYK